MQPLSSASAGDPLTVIWLWVMLQGTEDAMARIQAEERSHCRQLLAEAKSNNPVPEGGHQAIEGALGFACLPCRLEVSLRAQRELKTLAVCRRRAVCQPDPVWRVSW